MVAAVAILWCDVASAQRGRVGVPPPTTPPTPTVRIPIPSPQILPPPIRPDDGAAGVTAQAVNLLAFVSSPQQAAGVAAVLAQRGLTSTQTTSLDFLNSALVSFQSPGGLTDTRVSDLPTLFPGLVLASNGTLAPATTTEQTDPRTYGPRLVGWKPRLNDCDRPLRLGMVDTGVALDHPALVDRQIIQRWFVDGSPDADLLSHGTGVAGLLVGDWPDQDIAGLLPNAVLLSASIFGRSEDGSLTASVEHAVIAIDWLGGERADVVNLSLAGPANAVLDHAVNLAAGSGLPLVAAAGNGGPDGPQAYPAASAGAFAVTALDPQRRIYRHATQGGYVDVAAPGVDIWTAAPSGGGAFRSGTSMATPFVAVMVGLLRAARPSSEVEALYMQVRAAAEDLGESGHDPVFGWGLAHLPAAAACDGEVATDR